MLIKIKNTITNKLSQNQGEKGNSFLMYLLLIPALVFTMGFGIQVSISQYVRTELQSSLDMATQAAVSLAQNGRASERNVSISQGLINTVRTVYDANRMEKVGGIVCQTAVNIGDIEFETGLPRVTLPPRAPGTSGFSSQATSHTPTRDPELIDSSGNSFVVVKPPSNCGYREIWSIFYKGGQPYLRVQVIEFSSRLFATPFGSNNQMYNIISEARITRAAG